MGGSQLPIRGFTRYRSTLLFCDIRSFTTFFDRCPPEETYVFVTSVLRRIAKIVEGNNGKISNFTGDGFLAQFALGEPGMAEADSIRSAILIREELMQINRERHFEHDFTFLLGIGIHTGTVAGGEVDFAGYPLQLVLGDVVNTASRIESLCKFFSVDILISESTEEAVRGIFPLLPMPPKELRGKTGKYKTFWVMPTAQIETQWKK